MKRSVSISLLCFGLLFCASTLALAYIYWHIDLFDDTPLRKHSTARRLSVQDAKATLSKAIEQIKQQLGPAATSALIADAARNYQIVARDDAAVELTATQWQSIIQNAAEVKSDLGLLKQQVAEDVADMKRDLGLLKQQLTHVVPEEQSQRHSTSFLRHAQMTTGCIPRPSCILSPRCTLVVPLSIYTRIH